MAESGIDILDYPGYRQRLESTGANEIAELLTEGEKVSFGSISGTVFTNDTARTLVVPDILGGTIAEVPPGKRCFQLDFTPKNQSREPRDEVQARQNLRLGIEALPGLCDYLTGKEGEDITMLIGLTNLRMAQFAVRRLGYTSAVPISEAKEARLKRTLVVATKEKFLAAVRSLPAIGLHNGVASKPNA